MKNKTALTDADHILDMYRAQQVGTVVCIESFACEDEDTGEVLEFTAGTSYIASDDDVARAFPKNFAVSTRAMDGTRDGVPVPGAELRSESPPAPDLSGLLVCIHGFEFQDPDSGYPRWVRYGHDYVRADDWLAEHYPENFVRVEDVVPSDGIPHLPYPDE
jgi:hypothetical protein